MDKLKDSFAVLRDILISAGIVLFLYGWAFAHYYFRHFGVTLSSLELPIQNYYFYSWIVIGHIIRTSELLVWLVAGMALVVLGIFVSFFSRGLWLILLALVGVLLSVGMVKAYDAAEEEAACFRRGHGARTVEFRFEPDRPDPGANSLSRAADGKRPVAITEDVLSRTFEALNRNRQLVLLTQTSQHFIVLYQATPAIQAGPGKLFRASVYFVPSSEARLVWTAAPDLPTSVSAALLGGCDDIGR